MKRSKFFANWSYGIIAVFLLEMVILSSVTPKFLSNLLPMTENFMPIGIMALSMTLVIIAGGIDLSIGSVVSFSGVIMGLLWQHGMNIWVAGLLAVLIGGLAGFINGQIIVRTGIQPLIATLATQFIWGSLAVVLSNQGSIYGFPGSFLLLGTGFLYGYLPVQLVIFVVLALLFAYLLNKTVFGRQVLFIGNSESVSAYSGVNVNRVKTWTYVLSGLTAGLSGVIMGSFFASVRGDMGQGLELTVITGCLVGGVNVFGGAGTIVGAAFGVLLLGMLSQGLNFMNVSSQVQAIITGVILILAVAIQQLGTIFARRRKMTGGEGAGKLRGERRARVE
ncbi:autoinducer 2 import system permease protein LsrD [Peptococcaceae bacterium CEB3]|nr:autoinducer 2 import system permease protein LsrD [Peptococcaceae bacterium CEB3]